MPDVYETGLKLMEIAEAAILTTITPQGLPETRAMLNLRNPQQYPGLRKIFETHSRDFRIYFTTNTSSSKFQQIRQNPHVCVYYCRPEKWHGMMLSGKMEIVADPAVKRAVWQPGWEMYYPQGPDDPDYTLLCLQPKSGKLYAGDFKVHALAW